MINIKRSYHFYAAHRNEELVGQKCANLHGHTYHVELELCFMKPGLEDGVTMLFEEIDKKIIFIINNFDHCLILHEKDPLLEVLRPFEFKMMVLEKPSSVENIAEFLFINAVRYLPELMSVSVRETESAVVTYRP